MTETQPREHDFHLPNHGFTTASELRQHLIEEHGLEERKVLYAEGMNHIEAHLEES